MAMRYPGLPPRVKSGLLGRYDPSAGRSNQMTWAGAGGGGGGMPWQQGQGGGGFQAPELSSLSAKYLKDIPEANIQTDQQDIYESNIGGFRQDVESALTQGGQMAIGQAAQSGREVADVMARYLPEAVKGFARGAADVTGQAGQLAQQGQVAKSELDLKRTGMANEMARFDQGAQQQQYQFMAQLQTEYQMNRERMANSLRLAQQQAGSQREVQSIQNAHQMQMQQMNNQFKMKAEQYGQAQQNARQSFQLRTYDRWQQADYQQKNRQQTIGGVGAVTEGQYPNFTEGGQIQGGGEGFNYSGGTGAGNVNFMGNQIQNTPQLSQFEELYKKRQQMQETDEDRYYGRL